MFNFELWKKKIADWIWKGSDPKLDEGALLDFNFPVTPVSAALPYESYDKATGLFINQKSIGFILELSPLLGASEEMLQVLHSIVRDLLPTHATLQVH